MAEDVNGGFAHLKGTVLKGTINESINAIMPLSLFKEHFISAKNWMKMSFGLSITLDPLGYTFE